MVEVRTGGGGTGVVEEVRECGRGTGVEVEVREWR